MTTEIKTYSAKVFNYIASNQNTISEIARQAGVSKEALAGAVAEEANVVIGGSTFDQIGHELLDFSATIFEDHQSILNDYNNINLPENRNVLLNPSDVSPNSSRYRHWQHKTLNRNNPTKPIQRRKPKL